MASPHIAAIIKFLHPTADLTSINPNVELLDNRDGNGVFINKWTLAAPQPTIASLDAQEAAFLADKASKDASRSGRKTAVLAKLGLVAGDIDAFLELIDDRNIN